MSKDFDPFEANRPPREEGWAEETQQIFDKIQNRGDQRIGQYLINVVRSSDRFETARLKSDKRYQEVIESVLWSVEADELLEMVEEYEKEREKQ